MQKIYENIVLRKLKQFWHVCHFPVIFFIYIFFSSVSFCIKLDPCIFYLWHHQTCIENVLLYETKIIAKSDGQLLSLYTQHSTLIHRIKFSCALPHFSLKPYTLLHTYSSSTSISLQSISFFRPLKVRIVLRFILIL